MGFRVRYGVRKHHLRAGTTRKATNLLKRLKK